MTKKCSGCFLDKANTEFYMGRRRCKKCISDIEKKRSNRQRFCPNCKSNVTVLFREERERLRDQAAVEINDSDTNADQDD